MMNNRIFRAILWCALLFVGLSFAHAQSAVPVDLVLFNGNIHTLNSAHPQAQAVAISRGRIFAVGSDAGVKKWIGADTKTIDLHGATVIPGLADSHIHIARLAKMANKVQMSDVRSIAELLARIRDRAEQVPDGQWIETASNWYEGQLRENRLPTRRELDRAAPDNPVLVRRGGHNAVANSLALKLAGIDKNTPDPEGGRFVRDDQGRLTGWLQERPAITPVAKLIPPPTREEFLSGLKKAVAQLNALGLTSIRTGYSEPGDLSAFERLRRAGDLTLRVTLEAGIAPKGDWHEQVARWSSSGINTGFGDHRLRLGGFGEIYADGGAENALLSKPYKGKPGYYGEHVTDPAKIRAIAEWACEHHWRMSVHVVGDAAVQEVLDIYEQVNRQCPIRSRHWTLEHAIFITKDQLRQARTLGVVLTDQISHLYMLGQAFVENFGQARSDLLYPIRTEIEMGFRPAGGTDAPVTPQNPFLAMETAVTRVTRGAGVLGKEQAVTPLQALKMHSLWNAVLTGEEDVKGSIEAGKLADMVVISQDMLNVPPERISRTKVEMTILGGQIVYRGDAL